MKTKLTFKRVCELIQDARMCELMCLDRDSVVAIEFDRPSTHDNKLVIHGYNKDFTKRQYHYFNEKDLFFVEDGYLFINDVFMICLYKMMEIPDEIHNAL